MKNVRVPQYECMEREELKKLQGERLAKTVKRVYDKVLPYRQKMIDAGADCTLHIKEGVSHVYPLFPIPEATEAIGIMAEVIK